MKGAIAIGLLLLSLPAAAPAADPRASLPDIEDEVMCPICGTPLEHSDAPQAERQRALIRRLIDRGADKDEIKDALVAEYGRDVLATPSDDGFELWARIVPPAALLLGVAGIAGALRRRGQSRPRSDRDHPALEREDGERLERELASFDS